MWRALKKMTPSPEKPITLKRLMATCWTGAPGVIPLIWPTMQIPLTELPSVQKFGVPVAGGRSVGNGRGAGASPPPIASGESGGASPRASGRGRRERRRARECDLLREERPQVLAGLE